MSLRTSLSLPSAPGPSLFTRLVQALALVIERRRARRELEAMDDDLLRDLGLHRSRIEAAVRGDLDY